MDSRKEKMGLLFWTFVIFTVFVALFSRHKVEDPGQTVEQTSNADMVLYGGNDWPRPEPFFGKKSWEEPLFPSTAPSLP